ncbi:2',3'-cyclic-nucleotide 3'-phosphodiesterase-like [Limulus polyphemus]|uniref:2',3'-cyclic-nucleotide 3'-phosphodiesterase-like n=1 Tax=Limulus polyphemus TaxID=6850 RepID=A0ABM1BZ39_LIMPO|nr:2',3'-cyclic-nucleotide 3'-phosphodiesterase-like [Limulus polyphemus]
MASKPEIYEKPEPEEIFKFSFLLDSASIEYLVKHARIFVIIRGPPGTRKSLLAKYLMIKYPDGVICSADMYFDQPGIDKHRNPASLKKSHNFCMNWCEQETKKGTSPIIVRNTNVRVYEMNFYLQLAAKACYTVIIADLSGIFRFDPKELEARNSKGLSATYLTRRIRSWEELYPIYTGWFASPSDSSAIYCKATNIISELNDVDSDFQCPSDQFQRESQFFCMAAFCDSGKTLKAQTYYNQYKVQISCGRMFTLLLDGFLATKKLILGVVLLTSDQQDLTMSEEEETSSDNDITDKIMKLCIGDYLEKYQDYKLPSNAEASSKKTLKCQERRKQFKTKIDDVSFIILAHRGSKVSFPYIRNIRKTSRSFFSNVINKENLISDKHDKTTSSGSFCKLEDGVWFIQPKETLLLDTVFTGMYFW